MLVSSREACQWLAKVGLKRSSAQRVLDAGLAGEPTRTRGAVLYDADRVRALVERPELTWGDMVGLCPAGFFVSRRAFDVTRTHDEQLAAARCGWADVSVWRWVAVEFQISQQGSLPFLATVSGCVALGADIVGVRRGSELELEPPGPWFEAVADSWFPTGPGRPWVLHLGPLCTSES
jgi:hypothetical protein